MNLHRLRHAWLPCLLPLIVAGCSTTMGPRLGGTPQQPPRSIAVVGDRPVSVSTGEPGSKVVAEADPEPRPNPKGRISGRVLDDQGEPVPNATVRLADGGAKGGKDIQGTTDKTGTFTLNGLRPGSTYTLVAEDNEGSLTGRIVAKTSEPKVVITLLSEEAEAKAARKVRPAKARAISNRDETNEEPIEPSRPAINREDIEPPAESADTIDPGPNSEASRPQLAPPLASSGWQNTKTAKKSKPRNDDSDAVATSAEDSPRRSRVVTAGSPGDEDEEGPNPLPPAIEPGQGDEAPARKPTSARLKAAPRSKPKPPVEPSDSGDISLAPEASAVERPSPRRELPTGPTSTEMASVELPPVGTSAPEASSALMADAIRMTRSEPTGPTVAPQAGDPMELPPIGAIVGTPVLAASPPGPPPAATATIRDIVPANPASEPVFASQAPAKPLNPPVQPSAPSPSPAPANPADYNPFANIAATPTAAPTAPSLAINQAPVPVTIPPEVTSVAAPDGSDLAAPVTNTPKMKWGDIASADPKPKPTVKVEPTKATFASAFTKRFRPSPTVAKPDPTVALCSYDSRLLRLKDFRLPDLEGKPVRFQDLDADFVLIDFWGTWCSPCLESIPHLIDLQKKYGPQKLKVVGIACEEVAPEQRKAKVEEVARKMGINYPILLSSMDGKPCPVQQALAVQAMPTMILLDRKGSVLWRSTGSTAANESRLDRILASKMSTSETARR